MTEKRGRLNQTNRARKVFMKPVLNVKKSYIDKDVNEKNIQKATDYALKLYRENKLDMKIAITRAALEFDVNKWEICSEMARRKKAKNERKKKLEQYNQQEMFKPVFYD